VNALGQPLTYRQWKPLWKAAAVAAKVEATAHALRHVYASALIAGGASVKQVQMVLGHASAVITLRTYAHLGPGDDDRTRSIIDAILSPPRTLQGLRRRPTGKRAGQSLIRLTRPSWSPWWPRSAVLVGICWQTYSDLRKRVWRHGP